MKKQAYIHANSWKSFIQLKKNVYHYFSFEYIFQFLFHISNQISDLIGRKFSQGSTIEKINLGDHKFVLISELNSLNIKKLKRVQKILQKHFKQLLHIFK